MESVDVNLTLERGLSQAYMLRVTGPKVARRGQTIRVRVQIQGVRGGRSSRTLRVKVPQGIPRGRRALTLTGPDSDEAGVLEIDLAEALFGDIDEALGGPRTVEALRKAVAGIGRYDGVEVSFPPPPEDDDLGDLGDDEIGGAEGRARRARKVFRDPDLRLSGTVRLRLRIR
jgi:hypothetical protein